MILLSSEKLEELLIGTIITIKLFLNLCFIIHPEKSSLQASQEVTYLGSVFNSKAMLVTLTSDRREKIIEPYKIFLKSDSFIIRKLSSFIGNLRSTLPGNKFGSLYYQKLDKCKILRLKKKEF